MANNVFAIPVFFILFRETLETVIIVSVLLSFLKQTLNPEKDASLYKRLRKQVWFGVLAGLAICLVIGCAMIGAFYGIKKNSYAKTEDLWEGVFGLLATLIISIVGAALLRVNKLQDKWKAKLGNALEKSDSPKSMSKMTRFKRWNEKYAMFMLPFITVLREGLEAVVFTGGVGLGLPATSFPLAVICGLGAGVAIGYILYKFGTTTKLQIFLIISTCFLYLVAAGLFSKAVWNFEMHAWAKLVGGDAAEAGSGPGSYDIRKSVWHVNCCNPEINGGGGWGVFNSLFGWTNSATYGSVLSYNLYWLLVMVVFASMRFYERNGRWPLMKAKSKPAQLDSDSNRHSSDEVLETGPKKEAEVEPATTTTVREITA